MHLDLFKKGKTMSDFIKVKNKNKIAVEFKVLKSFLIKGGV